MIFHSLVDILIIVINRHSSFIIVICIFLYTLTVPTVFAAKSRTKKTSTAPATPQGLTYSSAKLSRPTNSVVVTFKNIGSVERIDYILSYIGSGVDQGVGGSIRPSGQSSESRDLYFGTCSHGVCTAHRTITNAQLMVTTVLRSGARNIKRYRIKV